MNTNTRNILMIDDDHICRMVVKKQIESSEYSTRIVEHEGARSAFEELKAKRGNAEDLPDVIFLDLFMPEVDGWQFLEMLEGIMHEMAKAPQIYILSTTIDERDIERADDHALVTGFIPKPIKMRQVQRIIYKVKFYGLTA